MWHRTRLALPIAIAGLLWLHAAPAAAHDDDGDWHRPPRHERHERGWERHDEGEHRGYGWGHGYRGRAPYDYAPRYVVRPPYRYPAYPVYEYGPGPSAYYCGPCGHYFESYPALSFHVRHHHHIAVISLPSVIFQARIGGGAGWVFGGF